MAKLNKILLKQLENDPQPNPSYIVDEIRENEFSIKNSSSTGATASDIQFVTDVDSNTVTMNVTLTFTPRELGPVNPVGYNCSIFEQDGSYEVDAASITGNYQNSYVGLRLDLIISAGKKGKFGS